MSADFTTIGALCGMAVAGNENSRSDKGKDNLAN